MNDFQQGALFMLGIMMVLLIAAFVYALVSRWQSSAKCRKKQGEMLNLEPYQETSEVRRPMATSKGKTSVSEQEKGNDNISKDINKTERD